MPSTTSSCVSSVFDFHRMNTVFADFLHRFGYDLADGLVIVRRDGADLRDHVARHGFRQVIQLALAALRRFSCRFRPRSPRSLLDAALSAPSDSHRQPPSSHPRDKSPGPERLAVVVPSPATSEVFEATSRTICAPMFSSRILQFDSFATVTPSLVMSGIRTSSR